MLLLSSFVFLEVLLLFCPESLCLSSSSVESCEYVTKNETSEDVCVRLQAAINVSVSYPTTDGDMGFKMIPVPCDASYNGTCNNDTDEPHEVTENTLIITDNRTDLEIIFYLKSNENDKTWNISNISVTVPFDLLNGSIYNDNQDQLSGYIEPDTVGYLDYDRSYRCKSNITFQVTLDDANITKNHTTMHLLMANITMQAFKFSNSTAAEFGKSKICFQDIPINMTAPIVIGSVIGGAVVAVLILYIASLGIKRYRRSKNKDGYEPINNDDG